MLIRNTLSDQRAHGCNAWGKGRPISLAQFDHRHKMNALELPRHQSSWHSINHMHRQLHIRGATPKYLFGTRQDVMPVGTDTTEFLERVKNDDQATIATGTRPLVDGLDFRLCFLEKVCKIRCDILPDAL